MLQRVPAEGHGALLSSETLTQFYCSLKTTSVVLALIAGNGFTVRVALMQLCWTHFCWLPDEGFTEGTSLQINVALWQYGLLGESQ